MSPLQDEYAGRCRKGSDIRDHMPYLYGAACRFNGVRVLELGVREGNSTAALLAAAETMRGHVWSVDILEPSVPDAFRCDLWTLTVADDIGSEAEQPRDIDVLFIDTSHHYGHTLAELRAYVPHVRHGGVVLCHDTELEDPYQAPAGDPPFPVARALDAYCAETGRVWINRPGCNGLGVMEV